VLQELVFNLEKGINKTVKRSIIVNFPKRAALEMIGRNSGREDSLW
jgi:hypothetical protein